VRSGGRSEEISQICVVWGKAVAVSRYHIPGKSLKSLALTVAPVGNLIRLASEAESRNVPIL
jgi:hypothetical protein